MEEGWGFATAIAKKCSNAINGTKSNDDIILIYILEATMCLVYLRIILVVITIKI